MPLSYRQYEFDGFSADQTAQWVRWNEFTGHLGNGLLKVDRGSMYNSLEVRSPLLDREVIETALRVDWQSSLELDKNIGKLPLRNALRNRVGFDTKNKIGFGVPMGDWLRGPLRPMFEDHLLNRDDLLGLGIQRNQLQAFFKAHLDGQYDRGWGLWILLSLALWEERHFQRCMG